MNRTGSGLSAAEKKDAYAKAFEKGKEVMTELAPDVAKRGGTEILQPKAAPCTVI